MKLAKTGLAALLSMTALTAPVLAQSTDGETATPPEMICKNGRVLPCPEGVEAVKFGTDPEADAAYARRTARQEARRAANASEALEETMDAEPEGEAEVVTEETSRSSDEDVTAPEAGDQAEALSRILGAAPGAADKGAVLKNGDEVIENTGDRLIVERNGELVVLKDENELLRRPGSKVWTKDFDDGSTRTVVERENGNRIVTIRDPDGALVRRVRVLPDGTRVNLIDETEADQDEITDEMTPAAADAAASVSFAEGQEDAMKRALEADSTPLGRTFSLRQVRENQALREAIPHVDLDSIKFATGSAAISPAQSDSLRPLGRQIARMIDRNPNEIFLIEGHTDTVGSAISNLALSDRRAESVALALTEKFDIPPENLIVQGYGERFLKVDREGDVRQNRRAAIRRITPLLRKVAAN